MPNPKTSARWMVIAAFAAIYLIWGSSYLGINFAIETIPPLLMGSTRFITAGLLLIGWVRLRGDAMPSRRQWIAGAIAGITLFVFNNGSIITAQNHGFPSGMSAVLIATVPMWMVLLNWLKPNGRRPSAAVVVGMILGLVGIVLLISPDQASGAEQSDMLLGAGLVLFAAFAWAAGSLYGRGASLPTSPQLSSGVQLFTGGIALLLISIVTGDAAQLDLAAISARSLAALVYLTIASSIVAFGAFIWLMRTVQPARVATYAYVNPVVAMFLGWLLANEALTPRMLIASGIIILAVVIINSGRLISADTLVRLHLLPARPPRVQKDVTAA